MCGATKSCYSSLCVLPLKQARSSLSYVTFAAVSVYDNVKCLCVKRSVHVSLGVNCVHTRGRSVRSRSAVLAARVLAFGAYARLVEDAQTDDVTTNAGAAKAVLST